MNPNSYNNHQRNSGQYRMTNTVPSSGDSRMSTETGRQSRNSDHKNRHKYNRLATQSNHGSEYYYKEDPYSPKQYHSRSGTPTSTSQVKNHSKKNNAMPLSTQPEYYRYDNDGYQPNNSNAHLLNPQKQHHNQQQYGRDSYEQYPAYSEEDYIPPFLPSSHDPMTNQTNNNNNYKEASSINIDSDSKKNKFQQFREKDYKIWVTVAFVFIIIIAVVWYFVWPRLFTLSFVSARLYEDSQYNWIVLNNTGPPVGVTANWTITMQANNADNWVPTHVQDLYMEIIDIGTGITFGKGHSGSLVLPAKTYQNINFTVAINYHPLKTDDTLRDLLNACYKNSTTTPSQGLRIILDTTYYISGIVWTSRTHNRLGEFACPI